ncbi:MAG: hypothetical protein M3371_02975 [Acidobacteriota bacterium]|nr:hypothetical protein [Acidobacteriota bacterium]
MAPCAVIMCRELESFTNAELREDGDIVVIFRSHFAWDADDLTDEIVEPVALARLRFLPYRMPGLRSDARDLRGVSFHWCDVWACSDHVLEVVKGHLRTEYEIHVCLRRLGRTEYTRE